MKLLFINANLHGHINPTLGFVKQLTKRGHQVDYYCSEPFAKQVINSGANWIGFSESLDRFLRDYRPTDRHPFYMLMEYMLRYDEAVLPELLERINKGAYDLVICDSIFGAGCFLKQLILVPVISSHSSFAMSHAPVPPRMLVPGFHPQLDHCYEILKHICETYQIVQPSMEQVFLSKGDLNIVYTTKQFNGDDGVCEPDYVFAGPSLDRLQVHTDLNLSSADGRPLLYISLGSVNTDFVEFYQMCISAFRESEYFVCMSIGTKCDPSQLGEIPSNFYVRSFLPQLEILKRADVFITHAGFNSVNEALSFGVPMLALPQVNDQYMVAKRLVTMHLGLTENSKELTAEQLKSKVDQLCGDVTFKQYCIKMSEEMRTHAQIEQSVKRVEDFVAAWKERR